MFLTTARRLLGWLGRCAEAGLIGVIRLYQWTLSPLLGNVCRFQPSCSNYMVEAVRKYGLFVGVYKGIGRVLRCHPWNPGGYDPP